MNRNVLATALASIVLATSLLAGCSSSDTSDGAASAATPKTPSATQAESSEPPKSPATGTPLSLVTDTQKSDGCFADPGPHDLAWFDVQWKARKDLDSFRFHLVGAKGVKTVGQGWTVPPVNYGGRIDYSGAARWDGWRKALTDRALMPSQMDAVPFWVPVKGQTGLLVLHLKFDEDALATAGASFDGVEATWKTESGQTGKTSVDTRQVFHAKAAC